MASFPMTL